MDGPLAGRVVKIDALGTEILRLILLHRVNLNPLSGPNDLNISCYTPSTISSSFFLNVISYSALLQIYSYVVNYA
jgi:hypothetical protein